jgi:GNAT superfamily N-acetyltransferase
VCQPAAVPVTLDFLTSPTEFLAAAGEHLAADSVLNTVVASVAQRAAAAERQGFAQPEGDWWLVARDGDDVVGTAMRAAPFEPRPPFLLPMPEAAAIQLARELVARGERVSAVNGALGAVSAFTEEYGARTGLAAEIVVRSRLHQAATVTAPAAPPGHLRPATYDEVDLVIQWFDDFLIEADAQAGRPAGSHGGEVPTRDEARRKIAGGEIWIWEREGMPVHLSALHPVSFGAARIGPVYTPPEHRGAGYAGATVAALTQRVLDEGAIPCLYTDVANRVSNALYARIGYVPVVDMVNVVLR